MVGRLHDTRLLENLVKCEKDYHTALVNLLALSTSSVASLSAYGAALSPSCSTAVLGVSEALTVSENALRAYADSIDDWREKLAEIRRLDAEIDVAMRDREILITRLIKVSKQKPKTANGTALAKQNGTGATKLSIAQSELQACESHLTAKQHELDDVIRSALLDGLEKRCKALVNCGNTWAERGRDGLQALDTLRDTPIANGDSHPYSAFTARPAFLRLREGDGSVDSHTSLAPSQSASQIGLNNIGSPRQSEDTHVTTVSNNPRSFSTSAGPSGLRESYRLDIPPAHSIEDHVFPSSTPAPELQEEELDLNSSSEDEEERHIEVRDNPARVPANLPPGTGIDNPNPMPPTVPNGHPVRDNDRPSSLTSSGNKPPNHFLRKSTPSRPPTIQTRVSNSKASQDGDSAHKRAASFSLFGSITGLFGHKSKSSVSGSKGSNSPTKTQHPFREADRAASASPPKKSKPRVRDNSPIRSPLASSSGGGWQTRTDRNLKEGRNEMIVGPAAPEDSSSDEDEKGLKKGSLLLKSNNLPETTEQPAAGPSTGFWSRKKLSPKRERKLADVAEVFTEPSDLRRLSRHSSDGALNSRSNSLSRKPTDGGRLRKDRKGAPIRGNASAVNLTSPSPRSTQPPLPSASIPPPLSKDFPPGNITVSNKQPTPSPTSATSGHQRVPSGGGKMRKRATAKHFDDGLGSSGGALLTGPPPNSGASSSAAAGTSGSFSIHTVAGGNTGLSGMGINRSASVKTAGTGIGRPQPNTSTTNRRSSLQHDGLMGAGSSTFPRSASPVPLSASSHESRFNDTTNVAFRGRSAGNNLMSIVESPQSRLEVVKAPASLTTPAAPTLYLPRASSPSPPPPPAKALRRASADAAASTSALVLPSEITRGNPVVRNTDVTDRPLPPTSIVAPPGVVAPVPVTPQSNPANIVSRNSSVRSNGTPSALMPPPLRSALRNPSPSRAAVGTTALPNNSTPSVPVTATVPPVPPLPSTSNSAPPPVPMKSPKRAPSIPLPAVQDADSVSVSSYETVQESMEESDGPTVLAEAVVPNVLHPSPAGNGWAGFVPAPDPPGQEHKGTDLSVSTATDSTSQPTRRKSVRMALPPSVSSTPAQTPKDDREEWHAPRSAPSDRSHRDDDATPTRATAEGWRSRIREDRDLWADDDSDAGGEYGQARRALDRATRALATAGKLPKEQHSSHR